MASNQKNSNSQKRRRRNTRSYNNTKKDELMDKVDKAFEESSKKNNKGKKYPNRKNVEATKETASKRSDKFSIADENYFTEEIDRSLISKRDEFYAHEGSTFNPDEEEYFAEMEKVYGSKLKKEEVGEIPEPVPNDLDVEVTIPMDAPPIHEEEAPRRSQEEYFAEMEKIYGSRLEKEPDPVPVVEENASSNEVVTIPDNVIIPQVEDVPTTYESVVEEEDKDMAKKKIEKEESTEVVEKEEVEEEPEEEVSKEVVEEKPVENEIESFDTDIMSKIGDDLEAEIKAYQYGTPVKESHTTYKKHKPNIFLMIVAIITFICAVIFFIATLINSSSGVLTIIGSSVLMLFTILFMVICITSRRKNIYPMLICCLLLLAFFAINIFNPVETVSIAGNKVQNFSGKSLTEVVKWANENKIKVTQEYEFSDMVPEYEIISQSVKAGTSVSEIDEIVVSVSEGPNPYKEIVVPSMLTWDSERVINYVLTNHLSNVVVEFVDSDQVKDTVIEQSRSGNLKRNDELKLVFSYGDEGNGSEVTLVDFTKMTQFEIEFYMKQHRLNYDFVYDFSDKAKKGYGMKQSVAAGTVVRVQGDKVQVTISKGPKIEIPDLTGKTVNEITEWAISKKLKLEFVDKYDDSVKYGEVISVDKEMGDVVEQGTILKVTLSLGGLKMPKFKNVDAFYQWADKYGIKYETKHEFSDSVAVGEVIEYSHKTGETIKNGEAITVTLSDGKKVGVPNLKGLSKSEAIKKLKDAKLNYNFIYKSNDAARDTVLSQSISAGSEVSSDTTITVTLSSGKSSSEAGGGNNPAPVVSPSPSPATPTCNACSVSRLTKVWSEVGEDKMNYNNIANALIREIEGQCPGIDVQVRGDTSTGEPAGTFISGFSGGTTDENGNPLTSCSVVHIILAK